jgi:hypothetical protein
MSQPRVIMDPAITGPLDFTAAGGSSGVNLFCAGRFDDTHAERFIDAAVYDEAGGFVIVGNSHAGARWARPTAASRRELQRVKFACSACGRSTIARAERFIAIVEKLVRHGLTKLTLAGLDDILSRS